MHGRTPPTRRLRHEEEDDEDQLPQHELARLLYAQRQQRNAPATRTAVATGNNTGQQTAQRQQLGREVEALAQEIETLTQTRDLLVSRRLNRFDDHDGSSVKAVAEYFRVFQRGLILSPVDAIAFLHTVAAEQIRVNSFMGRSVLIEQWKTYSMCWDDMDLGLLETAVIPLTDEEALVLSVATFSVKISRLTLAVMFPHVLQSKRMVKRLLGQKIVMRTRQGFVYDRKKKQFVRLTITMAFVGVFAKLLPQPTELDTLFSRALLTDEFYIGEVPAGTTRTTAQQEGRRDRQAPPVSSPDLEETKRDGTVPKQNKMRLDHIL